MELTGGCYFVNFKSNGLECVTDIMLRSRMTGKSLYWIEAGLLALAQQGVQGL
jgi:hypothetical protein